MLGIEHDEVREKRSVGEYGEEPAQGRSLRGGRSGFVLVLLCEGGSECEGVWGGGGSVG